MQPCAGLARSQTIVVTIPAVGHNQGWHAIVKRFAKAVVATVMNEKIGLGDDRGLRKPAAQIDIVGNALVAFEKTADIDEEARGERCENLDYAADKIGVDGAEASEFGLGASVFTTSLEEAY